MSQIYDIPPSMLVHCAFCADRLHSNMRGTWQHVVGGWVPIKRHGTDNQRGTNSLTLPKMEHVYACEACIDKLKKGVPLGQQSLFGTEYL